jgi:uncharacterized protein (DUF58 family)
MASLLKRYAFRKYSTAQRSGEWFSDRFTSVGKLMMVGLLGAGVLGVDSRRTMIYQVFGALFGLFMVSVVGSFFVRGKYAARRVLPRFGTVGQELRYDLVLTNEEAREKRGLFVREVPAHRRVSWEEFLRSREPGEEKRNRFDRGMGYYRFKWLVRRRRGGEFGEVAVAQVPPRGNTRVRMAFTPLRRGTVQLVGLDVGQPEPLGLVKALTRVDVADQVLILPRRYPLPGFELPGGRVYQPGGVAQAGRAGDSQEFVSLRDYQRGDPLRHIHWRSYARFAKPIVKEFQDEYFTRHALVLDTCPYPSDAGDVELFEEAVSVAASFAAAGRSQDALLDLLFVEDKLHTVTGGRGLDTDEGMLEALAGVEPCAGGRFEELANAVRGHAARISGCVCVFLAWDEERRRLVRDLRASNLAVVALVVARGDVPTGADKEPGEAIVVPVGQAREVLGGLAGRLGKMRT